MGGWPDMFTVVLIGGVVRTIWYFARQSNSARAQPLLLPPTEPRSPLYRPARPVVHEVLATAQEGEFITVSGRIERSTGTLIAPLSGTECVAYAAAARSQGGDREAPPSVDLREMKIVPLVIAVGDGTVEIEGDCVVSLRLAAVWPRDGEREAAFLVRRQLQHFLPSTEFTEAVVRAGDRVWVSGILVYESGGEHGYRDRPVRMRLVRKPGQPLSLGRARRGAPSRRR